MFPVAMPPIAGSGAITSIVLLTENDLHNIPQQAGTAITLLAVQVIVVGCQNVFPASK